jgi:hypothetical protein
MKIVKVTGINTVIRNLTKSKAKIASGVGRGLKKGGKFLQKKSTEIVPVQIGNLKASCFCRNVGGRGFDTDIVVGYTAKYAVYVHEDLSKAHGKEFNIKHADEIARAGRWSSSLKTGKTTFKPKKGLQKGTAQGGMFPRGENQQAKFLEQPARQYRRKIIKMIQKEVKV